MSGFGEELMAKDIRLLGLRTLRAKKLEYQAEVVSAILCAMGEADI